MIPPYMTNENIEFRPTAIYLFDKNTGIIAKAPSIHDAILSTNFNPFGENQWTIELSGSGTLMISRMVPFEIDETDIEELIRNDVHE